MYRFQRSQHREKSRRRADTKKKKSISVAYSFSSFFLFSLFLHCCCYFYSEKEKLVNKKITFTTISKEGQNRSRRRFLQQKCSLFANKNSLISMTFLQKDRIHWHLQPILCSHNLNNDLNCHPITISSKYHQWHGY